MIMTPPRRVRRGSMMMLITPIRRRSGKQGRRRRRITPPLEDLRGRGRREAPTIPRLQRNWTDNKNVAIMSERNLPLLLVHT
jgi:hypothetical protein